MPDGTPNTSPASPMQRRAHPEPEPYISEQAIGGVELGFMLLLALSNDFSDIPIAALQAGALAIPAAGQALAIFLEFAGNTWDIGTGFFLTLWLFTKGAKVRWKFAPGAATGVELIPGGDIIPSYAIAIILVYLLSSGRLRAPVVGRMARRLTRQLQAART